MRLDEAVRYLMDEIANAEMDGNTPDAFQGLLSAAREVVKSWEK
jgi:hypothetical protein